MAAQRCDAERCVAVPVLGFDLDASLQEKLGAFRSVLVFCHAHSVLAL